METGNLAKFIRKGDIPKVSKEISRLVAERVNVFDVESEGEVIPTLHLAAEVDKQGDILEKLVDEGADTERMRYQPFDVENEDYQPAYGKGDCTALTFAVISKNYNAVNKLLNLGADANGRGDTLENPIVYSIFLEDIEDAKNFTLLLVAWGGKFIKDDLLHILDFKIKKVKGYVQKDILKKLDYPEDYFFSGDKKERKKLIKIIDEEIKGLEAEEEDENLLEEEEEDILEEEEEEDLLEEEEEE